METVETPLDPPLHKPLEKLYIRVVNIMCLPSETETDSRTTRLYHCTALKIVDRLILAMARILAQNKFFAQSLQNVF
jgi:hypothetical protein